MAELFRPDLCIVGAGALGIELAQHARTLGASVVLTDRGLPEPGDGPETALRVAALQASAARAKEQRDNVSFGLGTSEPKIIPRAIQDRIRSLVSERAPLTSTERLTALGIDVVQGETRFTDPQTLLIGENQVRAGTTILALGGMPTVPAIAGLDQIEAFTADSILESTRKLSHLLVIGGDAPAFALAQAFARLGSTVTLVTQGDLLPGYDPEAVAILIGLLATENISVIEGAVSTIQPRSQGIGAVVDRASGEQQRLDISHVLVAMGSVADLEPLDPQAARLRPQRGKTFATGEPGQTANRRIRLVGVAAGIDQWQHALRHGRGVVEAALGVAARRKIGPQPRLIMTDPALVEIGRLPRGSEQQKPGSGLFRASLAENEAAVAIGASRGLVKVSADAKGRITGASLVGPGASEMAALLTLAMEKGLGLEALADLSLPHPSLMTTISDLALNYLATRPVSVWTTRRRVLRRISPF